MGVVIDMRLIDMDALGNRMYHEVFEKDSEDQKWDSGCWMRYKLFERVLREQPTIEPERKKGRWIDDGTYGDYHPHHAWHCSECEESVIEIDTPWFKFCPNCGADMRGEPDETD